MLMLRLQPNVIGRFWDIISYALVQTTLPDQIVDENYLVDSAEKCISGLIQVWACYEEDGFPGKVGGFVFTSIVKGALSNQKNLLIAGIYLFGLKEIKVWHDGYERLTKFAKGSKCNNIIFYTDNQNLLKIAQRFKGYTELRYGIVPLPA